LGFTTRAELLFQQFEDGKKARSRQRACLGRRGLRAPLTPHSIVSVAPPPCHGRLDARTVVLARRWPPGGAPARSRRSPSHPGRCSPHGTTPVARTRPRHGLPLTHASLSMDPRQPWSRRCLRARLAPPGCTSRTLLRAYSRHTAFCFNSRGVALSSQSQHIFASRPASGRHSVGYLSQHDIASHTLQQELLRTHLCGRIISSTVPAAAARNPSVSGWPRPAVCARSSFNNTSRIGCCRVSAPIPARL